MGNDACINDINVTARYFIHRLFTKPPPGVAEPDRDDLLAIAQKIGQPCIVNCSHPWNKQKILEELKNLQKDEDSDDDD